MTKNSISLGRAVAGVCMILAIAAVIGLLGSFAPSSSKNSPGMDGGGGGISGDISGVVGNTIKKGTYRWKNEIDLSSLDPAEDNTIAGMSISLPPLNCNLSGESGVLTLGSNFTAILPLSFGDNNGRIMLFNGASFLDFTPINVLFNGEVSAEIDVFVPYSYDYPDYPGFVPQVRLKGQEELTPVSALVTGEEVSAYGRTFIVNEDYLTNELFATWFSANTERVE